MDNIKDILKGYAENLIVDDAPAFATVFYGNDFETNARAADDLQFPMCQIVPPLASGLDIGSRAGGFKDRYNVFIFFCDRGVSEDDDNTGLDSTAEQNDVVIQRMRAAVRRYVADLNNSGDFEIITKVELKHIFFKFDASVSGLLAFFVLKDINTTKLC